MVQHHGTAVLGSPDGVKLVVVALAQRQERLQAYFAASAYYPMHLTNKLAEQRLSSFDYSLRSLLLQA